MNGTAVRRWHTYIGMLCAPSLIFFCLTGAVQIYSLHEAHDGYHPYAWVEKLSSVHKDQVLEPHHDHDHEPPAAAKPPSDEPAHEDHEDHDEAQSLGTAGLKIFFLVVSLAVATSAVLGVWIAVTQSRQKRLNWILLGLGVVLPVVLIALA